MGPIFHGFAAGGDWSAGAAAGAAAGAWGVAESCACAEAVKPAAMTPAVNMIRRPDLKFIPIPLSPPAWESGWGLCLGYATRIPCCREHVSAGSSLVQVGNRA